MNTELARAIDRVLSNSRWIGVSLARASLSLESGIAPDAVARTLYASGDMTLTKAREIVARMTSVGFVPFLDTRKRMGSAENPITKLFPAAITEMQFMAEVDELRQRRNSVSVIDERFSGHTLVDFRLSEGDLVLPMNVKNAGTRFENAQQLVGLEPNNCIPIPAYKANDAIDKQPNLLYVISVDYELIGKIERYLLDLFNDEEKLVWGILNSHSGTRIRDAEDLFTYGTVAKYWDVFRDRLYLPDFRVISARKAIRVLQKYPKRTPGIGLRAWGTGASAEVNVHISVVDETKPWLEIKERILKSGISNIIDGVNRRITEIVFDPEI